MIRSYRISNIQQTSQPGGFWLVSATLAATPETANIGALFHIKDHPEISLTLFQTHTDHLQLLSQQSLPEGLLCSQTPVELIQESDDTMPTDVFYHQSSVLLLGADLGIAPLLHIARQASNRATEVATMALLQASENFPFMVKPARFMLGSMPAEAIGCCPLLEDWKIPNRLASISGLPGCFDGSLLELFGFWLEHESQQHHMQSNLQSEWQIVAFLDSENLQACRNLSQAYDWIRLTGIEIPSR
ncbi:MAG: hypothetical protein R3189_05865 [Thiomicrorhabdus chilensis]|uniref:hypothetical protein n=1 Tax=Thiomicrorhabdus chilensis TaxID=63656 RepID=UPI00299ECCC5|nr:hypothetical protein [Thiomicrorhabdus chilensis]MDX1347758.1 hypothetical protein [Thiomicrorhabdus chilensis]